MRIGKALITAQIDILKDECLTTEISELMQ